MVERHWKGIIRFEEADAYIDHLQQDTFVKLKALNGFINLKILRRDVQDGVEFLIITTWVSIDAIKAFAVDDVQIAIVPKVASDMMITYDKIAIHYDVVNG